MKRWHCDKEAIQSRPSMMKYSPVHVSPSPVYPSSHSHVKDPCVFVHAAFESQGDCSVLAHSSISARVNLEVGTA